ncbi:capsular polysaccharide biosynthesis protein [Aeromonas caviae]|uniref:Polysaccharide export protein n=1 Tax=Aeromonas hydrophila TaxID=644 RepID=A0AAX3P4F7_AERHY|nr:MULTISPECIES: polysaccharide biosynthesis/export family protein [Aeromonas]GKQ61583.1 capsular polysaccharide biosynthesis protein [Aeromonas caviae]HDT5861704.1 polysaccharide export protein [Aeromonas hydrophila subsp. hydrophila]MCO4116493.1 polysaccharide export protein [Aeromonas hydrophila]MCV9382660.1 polysaccharide export protein [Aeromonas hydrophila]MDD9226243.1 polysaccharide export protein [Aeromonas hydrophila]
MNKSVMVLLLGCLFSLSGWAGQDPLNTQQVYRLAAGDEVEIRVYGEPDLSMKFRIDTSGHANYPYLGQVLLMGRTTAEVADFLAHGLKQGVLRDPMVTVNVTTFRQVFVAGEVAQPGGYEYQPGLTVEKAVALAGGFTDRAARRDISLRLNGDDRLLEEVSLQQRLNPGDIITIEQSFF